MHEYNVQEAQTFQGKVLERIRDMEHMLDREVLSYYRADAVNNFEDAQENLRGMHRYLKSAYQILDRILDDIERRPECIS